MDWEGYIRDCCGVTKTGDTPMVPQFYPPASADAIQDICLSLGVSRLPSDLVGLLTCSNGVGELLELDGEMQPVGWLVWPTEEIKKVNS